MNIANSARENGGEERGRRRSERVNVGTCLVGNRPTQLGKDCSRIAIAHLCGTLGHLSQLLEFKRVKSY